MSPSGTSGESFPVVGWLNALQPNSAGDNATIIALSVRWGKYGSVTSWTGICKAASNGPVLNAQWLLGRSNSSFEWDHVLTGSDIFKP